MTRDDAFLQAVIADPDDDGLRLAYADYLDERGDPRGEFIRVQVALERMPEEDPRRAALKVRERELRNAHWREWVGPLQGLVGPPRFRRGFIEAITIPARAFLAHADALFAAPVRQVRLWRAGGTAAKLANVPHLARLTGLEFQASGLGDSGLRAFLSSPHLSRLESLELAGAGVGSCGVQALADSPLLSRLTRLNLGENRLPGFASPW
jgi:uncharacterized protein (TIGR02996 family)